MSGCLLYFIEFNWMNLYVSWKYFFLMCDSLPFCLLGLIISFNRGLIRYVSYVKVCFKVVLKILLKKQIMLT